MFFEFLYCTLNCLCKLRWIFSYQIWNESGSFGKIVKWEKELFLGRMDYLSGSFTFIQYLFVVHCNGNLSEQNSWCCSYGCWRTNSKIWNWMYWIFRWRWNILSSWKMETRFFYANNQVIVIVLNNLCTGGEYVQKLHIKNVSTVVRKLKYRLPSTRYFSLAFPEVNNDNSIRWQQLFSSYFCTTFRVGYYSQPGNVQDYWCYFSTGGTPSLWWFHLRQNAWRHWREWISYSCSSDNRQVDTESTFWPGFRLLSDSSNHHKVLRCSWINFRFHLQQIYQ